MLYEDTYTRPSATPKTAIAPDQLASTLFDPSYTYTAPNASTPAPADDAAPAFTPTPVASVSAPPVTPQGATPPGQVDTLNGGLDYKSLIQNDPAYLSAQSAAQQAAETASARRRQMIRDAIIRYGGNLPPGLADQFGDIDQTTRDAAAGNQQSILAQLGQRYAQSVEGFRRGLAARGGLQSSELDYGQDQLGRGLAQQQYDAANALTSEINTQEGAYAGVLGQNAQAMTGAIGAAEQNVYANPAYRPSAASFADYDPGASATYGQALYRDESGQTYDSTGNPFAPQATDQDWTAETGTKSGYSPGVASGDLAYLYGGV